MKNIIQNEAGNLVETDFTQRKASDSEIQFSLGNGKVFQQGNFEEFFSGETVSGSYTKGLDGSIFENSGAWKMPYNPFAKMMINTPDWTSIVLRLNDEIVDLNVSKVTNYSQVLNVREASLERIFDLETPRGHQINISTKRFISFDELHTAVISYNIRSLNFEGRISLMPVLNGDVTNDYTKLNQLRWNVLQTRTQRDVAHIWTQVRLHDFHTCPAMSYSFFKNNEEIKSIAAKIEKEKVAGYSVGADVRSGDRLTLYKYVALLNSSEFPRNTLAERACELSVFARQSGWNALFDAHLHAWNNICKAITEKSQLSTEKENEMLLHLLNQYCKY